MTLGHVQRYAQNFELPFGDFQIDLIWCGDLATLGPLALDNLLVRETKVLSWSTVSEPQSFIHVDLQSLVGCIPERSWGPQKWQEAGSVSCRYSQFPALLVGGPGPWQLCASCCKGLLRKFFFCLHPLMC